MLDGLIRWRGGIPSTELTQNSGPEVCGDPRMPTLYGRARDDDDVS